MRIMSRSFTSAAVMYALAAPSASAQAPARPNYSGTWVLDTSKSTSGGNMPTSAVYTVAQHGDTLIMDRETVNIAGTTKNHLVVGIDGKTWKNTVSLGGESTELSSVASWDKGALVVRSNGNVQGVDFVQTDTWTMAADGKSFTYHRSLSAGGDEMSADMVFVKKN
jgi:hypothetical protein